MERTIIIHGSDKVMAMFGEPGIFYRGKWENIKVTQINKDEEVPLNVRKSLVGLTIPTIFTKEQIETQTGTKFPIPDKPRLAYSQDVVDILKSTGKHKEAEQLRKVIPNPLDMYVFEKGNYSLN